MDRIEQLREARDGTSRTPTRNRKRRWQGGRTYRGLGEQRARDHLAKHLEAQQRERQPERFVEPPPPPKPPVHEDLPDEVFFEVDDETGYVEFPVFEPGDHDGEDPDRPAPR